MTNEFRDLMFDQLDAYPVRGESFESLWDAETKPKNRRWNRHVATSVDADMYEAIQDLVANPQLPFQGRAGDFGRHAFAATIESLKSFLSKDHKMLWAVLQSTQRRLTAERYVITAEEQVKDAVELLEAWTTTSEWAAVLNDLQFALSQIEALPQAGWRRRVANEWLTNGSLRQLLTVWQVDMAAESPEIWQQVVEGWSRMHRLAEEG